MVKWGRVQRQMQVRDRWPGAEVLPWVLGMDGQEDSSVGLLPSLWGSLGLFAVWLGEASSLLLVHTDPGPSPSCHRSLELSM